MNKFISKLQYLTQDLEERSHVEQAQLACEAGCKWIQYRCLTKTDEKLLEEIHQIASVCDDWGATLIVTNHIHLLHQADIQGVHIEDMGADFKSIREKIGPDKTLGASANNFEDIKRAAETGIVDYIGCGPFSLTDTKPSEYDLLGKDGYRHIKERLVQANIQIPILAVGGVKSEDVDKLMQTGVYGIAVSSAVNKAADPVRAFKEIYNKVY